MRVVLLVALVLVVATPGARAANDAGADAGVPVTTVDFGEEDVGLGGDEVTTRNPAEVEFETTMPARFRQDRPPASRGPVDPDTPAPRKRGACASCAVGARDGERGAGLVGLLLGVAVIAARVRRRA